MKRRAFVLGLGFALAVTSVAWAQEAAPTVSPVPSPAAEPVPVPPAGVSESVPSASSVPAASAPAETREATPASVEAAPKAASPWFMHLRADEWYRYRHTTKAALENVAEKQAYTDQDLRLRFDFDMTDPSDHWSMGWALDMMWDVDGRPGSAPNPLAETVDASGQDAWFNLYSLQAEYHSRDVLKLVRLGRQSAEYGREQVFDGATVVVSPLRPYLDLVVFGGHAQHFFEKDLKLLGDAGDVVASGGMVVRPLETLRFDLFYRYSREVDPEYPTRNDSIADLTARYRYADWLYLKAALETLNKAVAETSGQVRVEWNPWEVGGQVEVKAQPATLYHVNEVEDPYSATLDRRLPNLAVRAEAWKAFTTRVGTYALHLGYDAHQLIDGAKQEAFNRNVGRVYALFTATDIGVKGPFVSAVFERWATGLNPGDTGVWSAGGSLGTDHRYVRAEVGSYYQLYKYDYLVDRREEAHVETLYLDLTGKVLPWLRVRARYECEWLDRVEHIVTFGLTQLY